MVSRVFVAMILQCECVCVEVEVYVCTTRGVGLTEDSVPGDLIYSRFAPFSLPRTHALTQPAPQSEQQLPADRRLE